MGTEHASLRFLRPRAQRVGDLVFGFPFFYLGFKSGDLEFVFIAFPLSSAILM